MTTATPPAVQNAPKTPTPKPYDPVQTVAGMFSGSIMRLAYVLQDPKNYSESTKIILAECTKKYQDALDDCQIQILDAKWYLERKLAENRARREAEAKPAPLKRKLDQVDHAQEYQQPEGTPTKRARSTERPSPTPAPTQQPARPASTSPAQSMPQWQAQAQAQPGEPPKPAEPERPTPEEKKLPEAQSPSRDDHFNTDDFTKPTPQPTPALTNDDFTFESMFEGPLEDNNDSADNDGLGIDFNMDDTLAHFTQDDSNPRTNTQTNTQTNTHPQQQQQQQPPPPQPPQPPQSQTQSQPQDPSAGQMPLLQGLEQFANQPDPFDSQNPATNPTSQPMQNQPSNVSNMSNPFTSNEPNIWDSMLADETMNFDNAEFENMDNMGNMATTGSNQDDFGNMNLNINMDAGDPDWDDIF